MGTSEVAYPPFHEMPLPASNPPIGHSMHCAFVIPSSAPYRLPPGSHSATHRPFRALRPRDSLFGSLPAPTRRLSNTAPLAPLPRASRHFARFPQGQQYVESCDTATYLLHVEKRLSDEGQRVLHYLDQSTKTPLVHILEEQLIAAHTQSVLDKGFHSLLAGQRHEDVRRLHRLFRRVGATDQVS